MVEEISDTDTKYYVWGLDLSQSLQGAGGVGGLIASVDDATGDAFYFVFDGNGNVGQLVDSSDGSVAAHYEYDPYGQAVVADGVMAGENAFRFSTKYFDGGMYYYGMRFYDPSVGRWISRDPLGEEGGLNLYGFAGNGPTTSIRTTRTETDVIAVFLRNGDCCIARFFWVVLFRPMSLLILVAFSP